MSNVLRSAITLSVLLLTSNSFSLDWSVYNDPGNISANSGAIFSNVKVEVRYDGNCGPDAYLETFGGCNKLNLSAESGGCFVNRSVTGTITLDPGGQTACKIVYQADYSSGPSGYRESTIKINQLVNWLSLPSGNVSISAGSFDIEAQGTTADINTADRTITATIANTKITFSSDTPSICSVTQFGEVVPLDEGTCTLRADIRGDDNLAAATDTRSWVQYYPDTDNDGFRDDVDVCPNVSDPNQADTDGSGIGDACNGDSDPDNDEFEFSRDNCPSDNNPDQLDTDNSGIGDACNDGFDADSDEWEDTNDNCRLTPNPDQADEDNDDIGDVCDKDTDQDGVQDVFDNCPMVVNSDQTDTNEDGIGDACPDDPDNDDVHGANDNCPEISNVSQLDSNNNGIGNACELDSDNDGIPNDSGVLKDNCPDIVNPDQADTDGNGRGDACEVAFVATDGSDSHDCLSWEKACRTIQAGINVAVGNDLPQVFVKKGAYTPNTPIALKAGVTLIGGFKGINTEILSSDANPDENLTLITGDGEYPNGDILSEGVLGSINDKAALRNRETLLRADGLTLGFANKVVLKGFTINASQDSALIVDNSEVELINLRFIANEGPIGSALNVKNGAKVTVNNVVFSANQAIEGIVAVEDSQLYAVRVIFEENLADAGSAILADSGSIIRIDSSDFTNNIALVQGAVLSKGGTTSLRVINSTFQGNVSANGAAIYIANAKEFSVINTMFDGNATTTGQGGAIVLDGGATTSIRQSTFLSNSAYTRGGAIKVKGGVETIIENVTFFDNQAGFNSQGQSSGADGIGGAVDATDSRVMVDLVSNTFVGNKATQAGGALAINNTPFGALRLKANLILGNEAPTGENVAVTAGISNNPLIDNGFNLIGSDQLSGLTPIDVWDFDASTSGVGTKPLASIIEIQPTTIGGDNYGSPLPVLPLLQSSEARNVIPDASCPIDMDQRGEKRLSESDDRCDVGAYEYIVLSCIEDTQRRQEQGEPLFKYCAPGFEKIEFVGKIHSYFYAMLALLLLIRLRRSK